MKHQFLCLAFILSVFGLLQGNNSLYASPDEFQNLIKQVLSWDIRSLAQRNRPHDSFINSENGKQLNDSSDNDHDEEASSPGNEQPPSSSGDIMYHLTLEGLEVSYRLNSDFSVVVEKVKEVSNITDSRQKRCNYSMWRVWFVFFETWYCCFKILGCLYCSNSISFFLFLFLGQPNRLTPISFCSGVK